MADDEAAVDRRMFLSTLLAAAAATLTTSSALADRGRRRGKRKDDDDSDEDDDDDDRGHDAAWRARASGEIAPLSEILKHVRQVHPGEVVEVELEREGGRWLYEIKLITSGNRYLEIYVDAKTKTILKVEGE